MFNSWIFWAFAASISWSVGQIVSKKSLDNLSPLAYNLLGGFVGFLTYLPFAFILGVSGRGMSLADFAILALATSAYLLYYYVTSLGQISLVGTIWACYPITTIIFSIIFLGEKITNQQVFFVFIILFGVALIGLPQKLKEMKLEPWFWLAVFCAGLVGVADFLIKGVIGRVPMGDYYFIYNFATLPVIALCFLLDKKGRVMPKMSSISWLFASFGSALFAFGNIFFFMSLSKGPASLVAPVSSSYQAITVVLALVFLKDKLRKVQVVGVALAALGVMLVGA